MSPSSGPAPGARIGVYRIVRELGSGGMGSVYLGERDDDQFRQTVAIKLVHRAALGEEGVRRFSAERQVLASLDHPHIVHLLDGGQTPEGVPYLVMDYVEGVPLDRYCQERALNQVQVLELFLQICAAVHYAHQHLIVHCDIKPGNILVTGDGQPKLLDFGIAKLLERKLSLAMTEGGLRPMTLDAASPEQVRGEPITTATDVYALGIVLYRLLTGRTLWKGDAESPAVLMHRILEEDPDPPGLGNELDDILRMALRKEPARRYPSVDHFAADIQRFLTGRPVTARPATHWYVTEKFVRRNRIPVALAAAMILVLITGIVTTTRAARMAVEQRTRADRRFQDVRKLSQSLFEIHDQIKSLPGSTPARQLLADRALDYHNSLVREASGDSALLEELAEGYLKLGDVQGNPYEANLGDATGAMASYQRALEIAQRLSQSRQGSPNLRQLTARMHNRLSDVLPILGKLPDAVDHRRKAIALLESSGGAETQIEMAVSYEGLGDQLGNPGLVNLGDRSGALASYRKSLAIWDAILKREPNHPRARRAAAIHHMKIADLRFQLQEVDGARQDYQQALTVFEALAGEDQFNVPARRALSMIHRKWGEFLAETGDAAGAVGSLDKAHGIVEIIAGADPANSQAQMDVVTVLHSLAQLRQRTSDTAGALAGSRRGVEILESLSKADPSDKLVRERLSVFLLLAGDLERPKDLVAGARRISQALDLMKSLADEKDATPDRVHVYARSLLTYTPQRAREALDYAERACQATQFREPQFLDTLSSLHFESGNRDRAVELINKALALTPPPAPGSKPTALRAQLESHLQQFQAGK